MVNTRFNLNRKLTSLESYVVSIVIDEVIDCMEPCDILSENTEEVMYSDKGNFLFQLSSEEMKALKRASKKI